MNILLRIRRRRTVVGGAVLALVLGGLAAAVPAQASTGPSATSAPAGIGGSPLITDSLNPNGVTAPDDILSCATSQATFSGWNAVTVPMGCLTEYNGESVKVTWSGSGVSTQISQQTDGNLVVQAGNNISWNANTTYKGNSNGPGCLAQFASSADLVVSNCSGTTIFDSGAHTSYPDAVLAFQADGNVVIYESPAGTALWSSKTNTVPSYYNTYTTVATLGNAESCTADEGFAVGSTYTYSVKIDSAQDKAVIYRTTMSDGTVTLMSNGDTGTDYATYLGEGNDVALMSDGGNYYMYIVTMNAGSTSLVKLQYTGTTYYKVGSYTLTSGGTNVSMSGVKIVQKDASNAYFLFKSGKSFYSGSLGLTATSGSIPLTHIFDVDIDGAEVDGSTVSNIDSFTTQGIGYHDGSLYFTLTLNNVSIVLVYDDILDIYNATAQVPPPLIEADSNLSFRITSSTYPYEFQIEGVGVTSAGALWFSANRETQAGDLTHDGVFYFDDYVAS